MTLTPRAQQYLRENYEQHTIKHMAGHLHVSPESVRRFLRMHDLIQPPKPTYQRWTKDNGQILDERKDFAWVYPTMEDYGITGRVRFPKVKIKVW